MSHFIFRPKVVPLVPETSSGRDHVDEKND